MLAAAIDIGSNAIRLRIGGLDADGRLKIVHQHREAVRLGHEAFTAGRFAEQTLTSVEAAFQAFQQVIGRYPVQSIRAAGTSALRDSENTPELVKRVANSAGIPIEIISGEEEARLIHMSIRHRLVDIDDRVSLLIDIGGGSVEITLCEHGDIVAVESFRMGTVRLMEWFSSGDADTLDHSLMNEYIASMLRKVREALKGRTIDICVGTGGNIEALGDLGVNLLGNESGDCLSAKDIRRLCKRLKSMTCAERVEKLLLRPDRADVIIPATLLLKAITGIAEPADLLVPRVGLGDGILLDLLKGHEPGGDVAGHQALAWAAALAEKFHADIAHAAHVTILARSLFEQFQALHGMNARDLLLLDVATQIHEIGLAVRPARHHRHAEYLVSASPMIGLSLNEKALVAAILRCQRKRFPEPGHEPFDRFSGRDQKRLQQFTILLRLAIALDKERRGQVTRVELNEDNENEKQGLTMTLYGSGDRSLEAWSVRKQMSYLRLVFGRDLRIVVADPEAGSDAAPDDDVGDDV